MLWFGVKYYAGCCGLWFRYQVWVGKTLYTELETFLYECLSRCTLGPSLSDSWFVFHFTMKDFYSMNCVFMTRSGIWPTCREVFCALLVGHKSAVLDVATLSSTSFPWHAKKKKHFVKLLKLHQTYRWLN